MSILLLKCRLHFLSSIFGTTVNNTTDGYKRLKYQEANLLVKQIFTCILWPDWNWLTCRMGSKLVFYAQSTCVVISGQYTSHIVYLIFNNVCLKIGLYAVLKPCLKGENTNITKNYLKFIFFKKYFFLSKSYKKIFLCEISWNNMRNDLAVKWLSDFNKIRTSK